MRVLGLLAIGAAAAFLLTTPGAANQPRRQTFDTEIRQHAENLWERGRKIFRRDELENQPAHTAAGPGTGSMAPSTSTGVTGVAAGTPFSSARPPEGPPVKSDGRMDVAELALPHQGGPSPFGDDQEFPLPPGNFTYNHPAPDKDDKH